MNCRSHRRRENRLGSIGPTQKQRVARHLASCAACRRDAAHERQLDADFARLRASPTPQVDLREQILSKLDLQRIRAARRRAVASPVALTAAAAWLVTLGATSLVCLWASQDALTEGQRLLGLLLPIVSLAKDTLGLLAGLAGRLARLALQAVAHGERLLSPIVPFAWSALFLLVAATSVTMIGAIGRDLMGLPSQRTPKE